MYASHGGVLEHSGGRNYSHYVGLIKGYISKSETVARRRGHCGSSVMNHPFDKGSTVLVPEIRTIRQIPRYLDSASHVEL